MSINPNVSTADVAEPVVQNAGDAPVSFDELDRMNTKTKVESAPKPKAEKTEKKTEAKEKPSGDSTPKEAQTAPEGDGEAPKPPTPSYKVKVGDQEIDIPADTKISVKVNGKDELVSFSDLRNGYSGQSHLTKQFNDFKKQRDEFTKERDNLDYAVSQFHDLMVNQKDPRRAIEYLGELLGADGAKIWSDAQEASKKQFEEYSQLSPEERRERELQDQLSYYQKKEQALKTEAASRKETQSLESQAQSAMQKYSLDQETFVRRYDELKKSGRIEDSQITPELIGKYHENVKKVEFVESLVSTQYPDLENKDAEIDRISTLCLQMGASEEEITEVVSQVLGDSAEKKLSKKVNQLEKKAQSQTGKKPRSPQTDPTFFAEL